MVQSHRVEDVFRPGGYPRITYVKREKDIGADIRRALRSKTMIVSLTGPSKSGKTVLAENIIGKPDMALVNCANLSNDDEFWHEAARSIKLPLTSGIDSMQQTTDRSGIDLTGKVGAWVAEASATTRENAERSHAVTFRTETATGPSQVIEALIEQGKTLVIDDFHYLERPLQEKIGRQLKNAAWSELPIIILSVPHRGDDPVRAVPDLRGRVVPFTLEYWSETELAKIAEVGFPLLKLEVDDQTIVQLARECLGSPQIMQGLCLDLCYAMDVDETLPYRRNVFLTRELKRKTFERAASTADCTTIYETIAAGPQNGGTRDTYSTLDGRSGDVYFVILSALAVPPPQANLRFEEIKTRIRQIVIPGRLPNGQAVIRALKWMDKTAREFGDRYSPPQESVTQWTPITERGGLLSMPDPYFLFYLRWKQHPTVDEIALPPQQTRLDFLDELDDFTE